MIKPISSITVGPRETKIEALRILSMLLVLVVHADYWSLGVPSLIEIKISFFPSLTRIIIEAISVICVNVFIFISGWFTIKPSLKGLFNFLFQCGYFLIGIYVVMVITGDTPLRYKGIADCLCLTPINWFIQSYIGLYVISPILNAFIENASKKQLEVVVIAFYVFQTIYGYLGGAQFIAHGYSTFSFIGLYLLAQYIKRFVTIDYKWGGVVFILTALINVAAQILLYKLPLSIFTYDNPMVILGAASLFIYFNGLKIRYSRVINYIAKSCFAVFLFHFNPNIGDQFYRPLCRFIYNSFSGIECLGIFLITLLGIFAIAIILDLPRRKIWDCISKKIPNLNWDSLL